MRSLKRRNRPFLMLSVLGLTLFVALTLALLPCAAQQIHRNSFEVEQTQWVKGDADTAFDEQAHGVTDQGAHDYQRCEYLRINARQGTRIYYQYTCPKAPIGDELSVSLWVKANRPGVQLLARVVFPREHPAGNFQDCLTTFIRGDVYRGPPGRWKRLELGRAIPLLKQQQQMMQQQLGRKVDISDAYIDAILLNVYGGPGVNEVWIDALEVGPVVDPPPAQLTTRPGEPAAQGKPPRAPYLVEFSSGHLTVNKRRIFFRGIRHTNTPIKVLRDAGFNTVFCEYNADADLVRQAADLGFWLVPHLPVTAQNAYLTSTDSLDRELHRFPVPENVLFWELGNALSFEQTNNVGELASYIRKIDPQRPLGVDAWDGLARYSLSLNLLGVHRWPLMTSLELSAYRKWLEQRRELANPGTFMWSWIQTHTPEWYTSLVYEREPARGFTEPIGPQVEQIRLLTYTALGVGCRGLAFWSDRFLADSHQGRDRLLGVALLNQEIEMLEPLLVGVEDDAPQWIPTSAPEVQAAVLRSPRGIIVLPMWVGDGSQYVPGQAAVGKLSMTVPQIPQSMQAWNVSPGDVTSLLAERVPGGTQITLPEFGLTAAIVFTSDRDLIVNLQLRARLRKQLAAQWTYDLAVQELEKIVRVYEELAQLDLTVVDAQKLLGDARNRLARAKDYWDNRLFSDAYHEAQRALRPARILMRALWDKATRDLEGIPVASPYAVSFFTLPRHVQFMDYLKKATPAANVLIGGDFELVPGRAQEPWTRQEMKLDEVELVAERVTEIPLKPPKKKKKDKDKDKPAPPGKKLEEKKGPPPPAQPVEGKLCLKLEIRPKDKKLPAPRVLERTYLALNSPAVRLPPGSLVRISAYIYIPEPIKGSMDGALFYDSAGGEPLAVRLTEPTPWKKLTLYRRVPASGTVSLTLVTTGLGAVYFDDVRIEPLVWSPTVPAVRPYAGAVTAAPRYDRR